MYLVFLLSIILGLSIADIGISNVAFAPSLQLFGRQTSNSSCTGCLDTETCCGTQCISAGYPCCQTDPVPVWCTSSTAVCEPCPAGLTCYAQDVNTGALDVVSWACCENDVCSFTVSSSTLTSTIGAAATLSSSAAATSSQSPAAPTSSQSPAAPTSSQIPAAPTSSQIPAVPTSSQIPAASTSSPANPPPVSTVTDAVQTTVTLPASAANTTPVPTPTSIQSPFSVSLVTAINTQTFFTSLRSSSTHSPIPPWNGTGPLLFGYCATPEFSLVYGPQTTAVYFIGVVGCVGDKTDCCPFQVSSTTATVTTTVTQTVGATPSVINQFIFPTAASSSQITLPRCPEDYETVSSVCCPSGYLLWDTLLGGITPCYSTTSNYLTPPPIVEPLTSTSSAAPATVTSTIVNVVYAMHYPVKSAQSGLSTGADAGIGVGSAFAAVAAASALFYFLWRSRRRRRAWYSDRGRSPQSNDEVASVPTP